MVTDKEAVSKVHSTRQTAIRSFREKWESMQENSEFMRLLQYSPDQLKKFQDQNRVPYVFDYVTSAINTYIGIQRDRRTEIFYYPVEGGDDVKTEVLNAVKDHTLQVNNFIYKESDVFQDGLIEKLGVLGYEWSVEKNPNGALRMFKVPPRQVMWDLNSREFDKSDATWMSRQRLYGKRELKNRYPERVKDIDRMAWGTEELSDLGLHMDYVDEILDTDLGVVALVEFWEKKYENRFFLINKTSRYIDSYYYDTRKAAEKEIRNRLREYDAMVSEANARGQQLPVVDFGIITQRVPTILKTEVAHDMFFGEQTLDEPFYPLDIYHPYFHDGDWWGIVDTLKDPQKYINKTMSMLDHWIGTMSKGLLLVDGNAPKAEVDNVQNKFSTTGGVVQVSDVDNYKLFESKGPAPQLFQMAEIARQVLEDHSGGRNFQGKKETASESGVAVRTRIEQGGLAGFVVYDNLRRWKMSVGEKTAWYLTHYMTTPSVVRIEGEDLVQKTMQTFQQTEGKHWFRSNPLRPGVGYLSVNTEKQNTLEGLRVDVTVDEARWSVTKNQALLQELNLALQSNPLFAQVFPPEAMLEFMNLPFSVKEQAKVRMKQLEERQAAIEAAKAIKPPSVSADLGDVQKLPPEAQIQFMLKYFGIESGTAVPNPEMEKLKLDYIKAAKELAMAVEKQRQEMESLKEKTAIESGAVQKTHAETLKILSEMENGQRESKAKELDTLMNIGISLKESREKEAEILSKMNPKGRKRKVKIHRENGQIVGAEVEDEDEGE